METDGPLDGGGTDFCTQCGRKRGNHSPSCFFSNDQASFPDDFWTANPPAEPLTLDMMRETLEAPHEMRPDVMPVSWQPHIDRRELRFAICGYEIPLERVPENLLIESQRNFEMHRSLDILSDPWVRRS